MKDAVINKLDNDNKEMVFTLTVQVVNPTTFEVETREDRVVIDLSRLQSRLDRIKEDIEVLQTEEKLLASQIAKFGK